MTPLLRTLTALLLAITVVAPSAYLGMQPVRTAEATCGLATAIAALFGIAGTAAEATLAVPVFPFTTNINTGSTAASTWENTIKECVIDTIFWIIKEVVIKSITKSIISWIRGGFKGSPAFVTDPHAFFKGVMLNTVSAFLFNEGLDKLLCSPFRIDIIFSFAFDVFGQKNNLGMLSCSLDKVFSKGVEVNVQGEVDFGNKYKKFVGGNFHFAEGGIPALMAMTNDMNNPYGTYFSLQSEAAKRSGAAQSYEVNLTNWGKGWLSQRCDMDGDSKTNDDEYTCTPGEYISEQVNKWSGGALEELTVADELGEIINALLAALVEKVLTTAQEGLLGLGSGGKDTDYWNAAMAATSTDWQTHPGAEGWEGEIVKPTPPPTPPGGGGEQDCGVHIFDCFESAGPTEVLAASFNDITTGRTAATYSGYVRVRVTGAGSGSHAAFSENDAFYYTVTRELLESSTPPSHAGAHLSYSTTTSYRSGGVPIKTYILFVEGVGFTTVTPEYSSENDYEFVIYVGDQARALRIGTGIEQGEVPNAGVFTVEVEPLTMKEVEDGGEGDDDDTGGTGDPGSGVWSPPGQQNVIVFDLSPTSNRLFVPGCINGEDWQTTGCGHNGSLQSGTTYAARITFPSSHLGKVPDQNNTDRYKIDRAEAGETSGGGVAQGAVTTTPGEITASDPHCQIGPENGFTIDIARTNSCPTTLPTGGTINPCEGYCVVPENTQLYLSFRPQQTCGSTDICRVQLLDY